VETGAFIDQLAASLATITRALDTVTRSLPRRPAPVGADSRFDLNRDAAATAQAERRAARTAAMVERLTQRLRSAHRQIEAARVATDEAVAMVTDLTLLVGELTDSMVATRDLVLLMRAPRRAPAIGLVPPPRSPAPA
jgi:predicted HAD superfamily Cof-like phosphohydrolase